MMICALRVVCIACAGQQTVVALAPLRSGLQKTVPRLLDALRPGARTAAFNVSQALPIYRAAQSRDPPTDVSRIRRDRRQNQARAIADRRQNQRRAIADRRQNQRRAIADVFLYARATRAADAVAAEHAEIAAATRPRWRPPPGQSIRRPLRVLSLDGGGMRGLNQILVAEALEDAADAPIADLFDLVVGTSIGGCGALFVHRFGKDAVAASRRAIEALRSRCFAPKRVGRFLTEGHTCVDERRELVRELCGNDRLRASRTSGARGEDRLRAGPRAAAVTTTRDETGRPVPYLLRTYRAKPTAPYAGTCDATLADAIAATSAAPTFFPRSALPGADLVDGGVGFNDPSLVALAEARSLGRPVALVSLGTGGSGETTVDRAAATACAEVGVAYHRLQPPLEGNVGPAEAREDVLGRMEDATRAWLREPAQQRALRDAAAAVAPVREECCDRD